MERLIFVMTFAYTTAIAEAVAVWQQPAPLRAEPATRDELLRLSLFQLGLRYLACVFAGVTPLLPFRLDFPHPLFLIAFKSVPLSTSRG